MGPKVTLTALTIASAPRLRLKSPSIPLWATIARPIGGVIIEEGGPSTMVVTLRCVCLSRQQVVDRHLAPFAKLE